MKYVEKGTRYYIVDDSGFMYYAGNGTWSIYFSDRYFWYENPAWMLDCSNVHCLINCHIVAEHYATD